MQKYPMFNETVSFLDVPLKISLPELVFENTFSNTKPFLKDPDLTPKQIDICDPSGKPVEIDYLVAEPADDDEGDIAVLSVSLGAT